MATAKDNKNDAVRRARVALGNAVNKGESPDKIAELRAELKRLEKTPQRSFSDKWFGR